jgi:putative sigma-54 modulation protein
MKVNIRGEKIEVTTSIKDYIEEKLGRLNRYFGADDVVCHVKIYVKNNEQTIEVTIPTSKFVIRAEQTHGDLYAAIDLVTDKLERQITKNKAKLRDRYKNVQNFEMNLNFETDDDEEEELQIVKRKRLDAKPMNEEEAILQMELLGHDFFIFQNVDENCISVLYRRKDGKFGIIHTK